MKIHLALAVLAVVSESILYCRLNYPIRSRETRVLARRAGKPLTSQTLYS